MVGRCGADRKGIEVIDWPNECTEVQKCPNPECGTDNLHLQFNDRLGEKCRVICKHCGMRGPQSRSPGHAIDLWNALTAESSWISVEDELPEPKCSVLACDDHGWRFIAQRIRETSKSDNLIWILSLDGTPVVVSHWQPLPEKPVVESKSVPSLDDGWISVKNELPPLNQDIDLLSRQYFSGQREGTDTSWRWRGRWYEDLPPITHWKPLDDPPVTESKSNPSMVDDIDSEEVIDVIVECLTMLQEELVGTTKEAIQEMRKQLEMLKRERGLQ